MPLTDVSCCCSDTSSYNCFLRKLSRGLASLLLIVAGPSGRPRCSARRARGDHRHRLAATGAHRARTGQHHRARLGHAPRRRAAALRRCAWSRAQPQLGRRHIPAAFLPAARHRRARAVPGCAESVGGFSDRRDRLQRRGYAGDAVRCRSDRGVARAAGHALRRQRAGRPHQAQHARCRTGVLAADTGDDGRGRPVGRRGADRRRAPAGRRRLRLASRRATSRIGWFPAQRLPRAGRHQRSPRNHRARQAPIRSRGRLADRSGRDARRSRQRLRRLHARQLVDDAVGPAGS